jgi:hypothetical protein
MTKFLGAVLAILLIFGVGGSGRPAAAQDANAILDKAIQALGGAEKLSQAKILSSKGKGTVTFGGNDNEATFQSVSQGLDHIRRDLAINAGGNEFKVLTALAGDKGWREFGGNRMELDKDAIANEKRRAYLDVIPITILPLKSAEFKVEAVGEENAGGKVMVGVKATGPDGKEFRLYFDKENGLPVRMVARVPGFMGDEFTQDTTYSDYREMGGIQKATKVLSKRDGEKFIDQQITEFRILDAVDPKTFAEP